MTSPRKGEFIMQEVLKALKQKLSNYLFEFITVTITSILSIISLRFDSFLRKIHDQIDSVWWPRIAIGLISTCLLLIVYIYNQRPKYKFLQGLGVFVDKKSREFICPSCKSKKIAQQLRVTSNGLNCPICSFATEHLSYEDIEAVKHIKYTTDWGNL